MLRAAFLILTLVAVGCSSDDGKDPSVSETSSPGTGGGSGGSETCDGTKGTIAGVVYLYGLPGEPYSELAPGAQARLQTSSSEPPIFVETDMDARFEAEVDVGSWIVGAEDSSGCVTPFDENITVPACMTVEVELVMDCFG